MTASAKLMLIFLPPYLLIIGVPAMVNWHVEIQPSDIAKIKRASEEALGASGRAVSRKHGTPSTTASGEATGVSSPIAVEPQDLV